MPERLQYEVFSLNVKYLRNYATYIQNVEDQN